MKTSKFKLCALALFAFAATMLVAGCDDVVRDATFREWCGENLCAWKLETGTIRKAPTWHKNDHGVELVATPTAISQSVSGSPRCLTFTTIADVDLGAQVTIGLDFNRDGTIDHEQPIAATGFREAKTQVTAPAHYDGIRFVVTKKGAGRAVLAQMRVQSGEACTAPPLALRDLPLGAPCAIAGGGDECRSGVCCDYLCSDCCPGPTSYVQRLPDGTNVKNSTEPCPGSVACERRAVPNIRGFFMPAIPHQCEPGKGAAAPGAECIGNDDCASGECIGAETRSFRASEGRTDGGVAECDPTYPDAGDERCAFYFVRGGRCR
jgi:hypothetical protein